MFAISERPFVLHRREDVSGVSGTGLVAHGIRHVDGAATVWWLGKWPTETKHRSMESVIGIHGHGGRTEIRWCDLVNDQWTIPFGHAGGHFAWVEEDDREYHSTIEDLKQQAKSGRRVLLFAKDDRDRKNLVRAIEGSSLTLCYTPEIPAELEPGWDTIVLVGYSPAEAGSYNRLRRSGSTDTILSLREALWTLPRMPSSSGGWLWLEDTNSPQRWTGGAWNKPYVPHLVDGDHLCAVDGMGGDQVWVADHGPGSDRLTLIQLLCVTTKIYVTRCIGETGGGPAAVPLKIR